MKWLYKCDACGCYLDPGEGLLCDDCRERLRQRMDDGNRIRNLLNTDDTQISMRMEEFA